MMDLGLPLRTREGLRGLASVAASRCILEHRSPKNLRTPMQDRLPLGLPTPNRSISVFDVVPKSCAHVGADICRTANSDLSVPEAASFHVTRFAKTISSADCADHNPACGRRSDYDLRTQLRWHARTQLTVLLTPPTALTPAHGLMAEFLFVSWDGEIWNETPHNLKGCREPRSWIAENSNSPCVRPP
jgi:hypothetical protein